MRLFDAARMLAGACIIYGLVSACSGAADTSAYAGMTTGSGGGDSAAATTGSGGGSECNCPAPTPQPPDVFVEKCDKILLRSDGQQAHYAIHQFGGEKATDLFDVVAYGDPMLWDAESLDAPQGSNMAPRRVFVQDGQVSVRCNEADTITFVRPAH